MEFTKKNLFQGDVQFFGITSIPSNAVKVEKQFLAASEKSGSYHALFGEYDLYELHGQGFVIDAKEDCVLNHSLQSLLSGTGVSLNNVQVVEKKDHRHSIIPKGITFVGIQQRFDPLSGLKQDVRD
jgi:hypothetical protein